MYRNTNNVNKTQAISQTTEGKYKPNIVFVKTPPKLGVNCDAREKENIWNGKGI